VKHKIIKALNMDKKPITII